MRKSLFRDDGLNNLDLTAIVSTALLAHSVRQVQRTAFRACNETGTASFQVELRRLSRLALDTFPLGTAIVTPP